MSLKGQSSQIIKRYIDLPQLSLVATQTVWIFCAKFFFFYIYPPLKLVPNSQCNGGELIFFFFFSFFVQLKALKNYIWNLSSGVSFIYTLDNPLTLKVVPMKTVESKICWNDSSKYWCMKPKLPPENTFSYVTFVIQPFHMAGNDQFRL